MKYIPTRIKGTGTADTLGTCRFPRQPRQATRDEVLPPRKGSGLTKRCAEVRVAQNTHTNKKKHNTKQKVGGAEEFLSKLRILTSVCQTPDGEFTPVKDMGHMAGEKEGINVQVMSQGLDFSDCV